MVRYTGRAKTRTGSVNTNQLGLKMSGCTSRIGHTMVPMKLVPSRVDCMAGACNPIRYHGVLWGRGGLRNQRPYCRPHATKCQAAAGGVGTKHNIPYYRIPKRGESGCTPAAIPLIIGAGQSSVHDDYVGWNSQVGLVGTGGSGADPQPLFGSLISGSTSVFGGRAQFVAAWTDQDTTSSHDLYMFFKTGDVPALRNYIHSLTSTSAYIRVSSGPNYSLVAPFSHMFGSGIAGLAPHFVRCKWSNITPDDLKLLQPGRAYQIDFVGTNL